MERLASGSSIGLAGWGNQAQSQDSFTLYLRIHSARNLAAVGRGSYCKLYLGNTEVVNGSSQAGASFSNLLVVDKNTQQQTTQLQFQPPTHRVFRTKVIYSNQKSCPQWNEKLELHVVDPTKEILTIRVKNQLMLFCPAIGGCAIPLCNVTLGQPAEQWFPLHKGGKPAGNIRLQLLLKQKDPTAMPPPAASESPMQRLIQQHCQQERERRELLQNEESMRRQQFVEQERLEKQKRRQREEVAELERHRAEELVIMQTYQADRQREEQERIQGYLQKQLEHEDDWQVYKLAERMSAVKVQEAPKDITKDPKDSNYYFADDMVTASTSMQSSKSTLGLRNVDSQEGNCSESVVEAVVLTNAVLGEVVHDALPSSDLSSDEYRKRRKDKGRRKSHSRKQSRSLKDDKLTPSQLPLFPRSSDDKPREEIASLDESLRSSEESSSSEEERRRRRRRRRRRKEKKARHKERRRRRKAKRKERRASDGYESSLSSSSSSSSSSFSSSSFSDERSKPKTRNHKKSKERARSQQEGNASSIPRAAAPHHSSSYGPDYSSNYAKSPVNDSNKAPPPYGSPPQRQNEATSRSGYIATMPPQPQQKRSMGEMLSTAADVTSILSDVASIATSVQKLAGDGDVGGGAGGMGILPDMSQFMGGQDLSGVAGLAGQDFSGLTGTDTAAQYF